MARMIVVYTTDGEHAAFTGKFAFWSNDTYVHIVDLMDIQKEYLFPTKFVKEVEMHEAESDDQPIRSVSWRPSLKLKGSSSV